MAVSQTAYFHAPSAHSEHASILECESNPKFGVWDTANEEREGRTARMSDRPMRLKYLTKMKIILCIFLLSITAVSVFGEPQELHGILGESVKFPAAVKIDGNLRYSGVTIGEVTNGRFKAASNVEYSDRVHWDRSTGLLSLSELRLEDSGIYTVQDTQQTSVSTFNLTVWEDNVPVSKPNVIIHYASCTIECTAERGTGVTLSWYREGEEKPYVSSHVASAPHLHLPQTVERSGTYTCEAKNSVSNEKASITVGAHCTAGFSAGTIAAIIIAVVAVAIAVVCAVLYWRTKTERRDEEALILDAFRSAILDKCNQGFIQDVIRSKLEDKCNQGLIQDDKCNQGLLQVVFGKVIQDEANQGLIKDAVRRLILVKDILDNVDPRALHEANQGLIKDDEANQGLIKDVFRRLIRVKDILDKVDPRALRSDMSDRSDELEDETPQTGSYIITSQP